MAINKITDKAAAALQADGYVLVTQSVTENGVTRQDVRRAPSGDFFAAGGAGTALVSGQDLKALQPGGYYCSSASMARQLVDAPLAGSFRLLVTPRTNTTNYVNLTAWGNDGLIYTAVNNLNNPPESLQWTSTGRFAELAQLVDGLSAQVTALSAAVAGMGGVDFAAMRASVAGGQGPTDYPIGTEFKVRHTVFGDLTAVVVAHDYLRLRTGSTTAHTMTCLFKEVLPLREYDAPEAFYRASSRLAAGIYHFTVGSDDGQWAAGDYQFELPAVLPANAQLCLSVTTTQQPLVGAEVLVYRNNSSTEPIMRAKISEGSEGTGLGTLGAELNYPRRVACGSDNYKESAIRQYLNAPGSLQLGWRAQTQYDRPPTWMHDKFTFDMGFESDFLAIVGAVRVPCIANNTYEAPDSSVTVGSTYYVEDRFYPLSQKEIQGTSPLAGDQSALLPYFDGMSFANKICRTKMGNAEEPMLRGPQGSFPHAVATIGTTGRTSYKDASEVDTARVAFTIV